MINDIFEARMKYIEAYSEMIRSELSYRLSAIRLKQVCEAISEVLGPNFLKELIEDIERCDEDE